MSLDYFTVYPDQFHRRGALQLEQSWYAFVPTPGPPPAPPVAADLGALWTPQYPAMVYRKTSLLPAIAAGFPGLVIAPPIPTRSRMMQNTVRRVRTVGLDYTLPV